MVTKKRNCFDISLGNLILLQQIPKMMEDKMFRHKLRLLARDFDRYMFKKFEKDQKISQEVKE